MWIGQFTQGVVLLYWVYCSKIIQQRILVVENFHLKTPYTYKFFSYIFQKLYWFSAIKLCELVHSHKRLYRCIECIVQRLYNSVCLHVHSDTLVHILFICFSKVVLVSCYRNVWMTKKCVFIMFFSKVVLFHAIKLFKCQKNTFGMPNTQYSKELRVHKHPSVFNTTYTIQSRVNCPNKIICIYFDMFFKSSIGFMLSNCLNAKKKKYLWNAK